MATVNLKSIADSVSDKQPAYIVCYDPSEEDVVTVYPPKTYDTDYGIDIFVAGNKAELWMDGVEQTAMFNPTNDEVADEAIRLIELVEADARL